MAEELELLKVITQSLEKSNIPYMITGSIAANFYTVPRMTRDIDIIIELRDDDVKRVVELFKEDFYIDPEMVKMAIKEKEMFNIIHLKTIVKIDFIIRKDTSYRALEFNRRRQFEVEGTVMWIVSSEDLVISKLFWAKDSMSEMQLNDVKNILIMRKNIDLGYIENWVDKLQLARVYDKVKS